MLFFKGANATASTTDSTAAYNWPENSASPIPMEVDRNTNSGSAVPVNDREKMGSLIEQLGWKVHSALTMARSEVAIRELSNSVHVSDLPGKKEIETRLDLLLRSMNDFFELSMKLDSAITTTCITLQTFNQAATKALQVIAKQNQPNTAWSNLFSPELTSISEKDTDYLNILLDLMNELTNLEKIAIDSKEELVKMADHSQAINRAVAKDNKAITNEKETFDGSWILNAQQKSQLKAYDSHQALLQEISNIFKPAAREIDEIKSIVDTLSETVSMVQQNASKRVDTTTLTEKGTLNPRMLRLWMEKFQASTDSFEEIIVSGRWKIQWITKRKVGGEEDAGLPLRLPGSLFQITY